MNRFVKTIIEFLLKRTEHLDKAIDKSKDPNDPMQKRMRSLLEKREQMKSAVKLAEQKKNSTEKTTSMSKIISQSLEAKKSAMNPTKTSANARKTNRPKKRGR
jgi:non-homologous end joining protein Ku